MKEFVIPPKEFWIDEEWGHQHYQELVREYANKWVAIFEKNILASNEDLGQLEEEIEKQVRNKPVPLMYIEGGSHVY